MGRKQRFISIGAMMIFTILACQSNTNPVPSLEAEPTKPTESYANPVPSLEAEPTKPAESLPTYPLPTYPLEATLAAQATISAFPENEFLTLKSNIFADPNTACVFHDPTNHVLSCLNRDGWRVYDVYVWPLIAQCPDGRIFVRREDTLYIQEKKTVTEMVDPYRINGVSFIACGRGNEFWVRSFLNINHFDGIAWTDYRATDYLGDAGYGLGRIIAVAPNGNLWMTVNESIATFDGTNWQIIEAEREDNHSPRWLAVDANGNVWVGDINGLWKYDGIQWSTFPDPEGFYSDFFTLDHENRIWVAGTRGHPIDSEHGSSIYTFDLQTNSWILKFGRDALNDTVISAMQFDKRNRLWVTTDYGLYIYDGSEWTSYHTYTSDLYLNDADAIIVLGDGPQLPAPAQKAPGSVSGKLVNPNSPSYGNLQVELCVEPVIGYWGITPCADQAYHVLTTMDADGNFLFKDVPVGKYYLMIQISSSSWNRMIEVSPFPLNLGTRFEVYPGTETHLGEIAPSP